MPGCTTVRSLDDYPELASVPTQRRLVDHGFVEHVRKAVPFEYIAVGGLDLDGYHFGRGYSIDTDMPPTFIETYFAEQMNIKDPLVVGSKDRAVPLTDGEANDLHPSSGRLEYLMRSFNIRNRLQIPLSRNEIFYGAVCFTASRPFTQGEFDFLTAMAAPLHRAVTKPIMDRFAASALRLTDGELHCLKFASHGLTSEDIAGAAGYRTETVNSYLKSAQKKLRAANRVQAVSEALRRQLIN